MCWRKTIELLRLCNTPATVISPFPFFAISLFLVSNGLHIYDFSILFAGIAISLFSNLGANLWNHCNDLKEDEAQGKETILTHDPMMQRTAFFIAIILYVCSILLVYYLSIELSRPIYIYFIIWALITWWYSDNLIFKKVIGFRLKDHYITELITYSIAWPTYTLSIWLIYSDLNATGIIISMAFFFFGISVLLLKDLKDISGDRRTGLKTFGVVFSPSQLIQYSCFLMVLYYFVMLNPLSLNLVGRGLLIMIVPFAYFLKVTYIPMHNKNWSLEMEDLKAIRGIGYSVYVSVIFIGLSAFL